MLIDCGYWVDEEASEYKYTPPTASLLTESLTDLVGHVTPS